MDMRPDLGNTVRFRSYASDRLCTWDVTIMANVKSTVGQSITMRESFQVSFRSLWQIRYDVCLFHEEPDRFNPGRFLSNSSDSRPFPNDKGYMTFGWGRRVCSGQGLAEQGTFISIARLLWAFRIQKAKDETGQDIPVDIFAYT